MPEGWLINRKIGGERFSPKREVFAGPVCGRPLTKAILGRRTTNKSSFGAIVIGETSTAAWPVYKFGRHEKQLRVLRRRRNRRRACRLRGGGVGGAARGEDAAVDP